MKKLNQKGQTIIALLIFMLISTTITIASIAISIINLQTNTGYLEGELALQTANGGLENALIMLERDPNYSGGTMTINGGTATISISGSSNLTIVSVGKVGDYTHTASTTVSVGPNNLIQQTE